MTKKKLAIIVPYRNRENHLKTFTSHMKSFLKDFNYEIIVVEQLDEKPFNRGKLLNIGAKYTIENNFDYMCFHDVDMLPVQADYSYPEHPTSLISELENREGNIFFNYFGGITLFTTEQFKSINGYSNNYWGWGYEDTDLFYRVTHGGLYFDNVMMGNNDYSLFSIKLKENDFIKVPIEKDFISGDFEINVTAKVESRYFDENKDYDEYPILSIPGYNIGIFYNSFNRYFLQVYDENKKSYSITSEILDDATFQFCFLKKDNEISFFIDDVLIGFIELEAPILNLENEFLYIGAFSDKENIEFDLRLIDLEINEHHLGTNDMILCGCEIHSDERWNHRSSIPAPVRREGLFKELYHDSNASINKSWIHKETRTNQIYFNNFVKQNQINFQEEGLNTLSYKLLSTEDDLDYIKLSVEI